MKRYTITLGASTTAGGKVILASANGSINGVRIALEDDLIFCPACKSQGKIKCIGPRIPETWNGKQVALENDLCTCGCLTPPKLIADQSMRCQVIEDASPSEQAQDKAVDTAPADTHGSSPPSPKYDLFFLIQDRDTGRPLAGVPYKITLESGKTVRGTSDQQGKTQPVDSDNPETATLEAPYYDKDSAQTDTCSGSDACSC